jgi:hypothetical protein
MANLFPLMPGPLRPALERLVSAIPQPWLLAPKSVEVFESKELCKYRLQGSTYTALPSVVASWAICGPTVLGTFLCSIASGCSVPTAAYVNTIHS